MKNPTPLRVRLSGPFATFAAALLFAALVAVVLRITWDPPSRTYVEYVPIGAVFALLIWDRLFPTWSEGWRSALCDALVVGLALMRVFIPPLPFISGHTLLATYTALTARRWPLRTIALAELAEVMYTKVIAGGGWKSMAGGLVVAGVLAVLYRRFNDELTSVGMEPHPTAIRPDNERLDRGVRT